MFWSLNSNSQLLLFEISKSCHKDGKPNTLKMLAPDLQTPASSSVFHLPCPFASNFRNRCLCLFRTANGRAQCSAQEIPCFPSWLTRKLFGSQLLLGGSQCPQGKREDVSAAEHSPGRSIHGQFMWSDHAATDSLCSKRHLCTLCAYFATRLG